MKIDFLIGCEESQEVTKAFRNMGIEAFSCDLQECSGGHPEWHIQRDIFEVIDEHPEIRVGIFFPPCTHLAVSGAPSFEAKRKDGRQQEGIDFFMKFTKLSFAWCIENPISIMSNLYRKPDQIINPYYFGDPYPKKTCLWLHNLPKLLHTKEPNLFEPVKTWIEPQFVIFRSKKTKSGFSKYSPKHGVLGKGKGKERSKTEPGLALAMAQQWSQFNNQ